MRSAVTVCLAPTLTQGPWVFWHDLAAAARRASELGFDAIELFHAAPDALAHDQLARCLDQHRLALAAVGTGAGKVLHGLTLIDPDAQVRARARAFIAGMIDFAARFRAPAIIGSMQGFIADRVERRQALDWLAQALADLGAHARERGTFLLYEPLNRGETDVLNRLGDAVPLLEAIDGAPVRLLADLYHLHLEEPSPADALRAHAGHIGHVHFCDSNRRPAGCGSIDLAAVGKALREIDYQGFVSAEALPYPDPDAAAVQTMAMFRRHMLADRG